MHYNSGRRPWSGNHAALQKGRHHLNNLIDNVKAEYADFADFLVDFDTSLTQFPTKTELSEATARVCAMSASIATRLVISI